MRSTIPARSASMAAAIRTSRRSANTAAPSGKRNITCRAAISTAISASRIRRPPTRPSTTATQSTFNSALLNERQQEINSFNVLAYQHSAEGVDTQLSFFNRYSQLHFLPDPIGDLLINGVASNVYRQSAVNGIQEDTAWRVADAHTLRFGFSVSAERSLVTSI